MSANNNENGGLSGNVTSDCDEHPEDAPHHPLPVTRQVGVTAAGTDKQPSLGTNRFAILSSSTVRKGNLLKSPIARDLCKLTERMVVSMNGQNTQMSTIVNAKDVDGEDAAGEYSGRKVSSTKKTKSTKATQSSKESHNETEGAAKYSHGRGDNECESNGEKSLLLCDSSDNSDDDELDQKETNSRHHHHRQADDKIQSACGTNLSDERLIRIEKQFAGGRKAAARYAAKNCSQKHAGLLVSNSHQELQHRYTHLLVTDFEATCDSAEPEYPHEIIEFPCVAVDLTTLKVVDEFGTFVKPTKNPILSEFCTELTTITQKDVDTAPTIVEALTMFNLWLENLRQQYEQIDGVPRTTSLLDGEDHEVEPSSPIPTSTATTASGVARRFNPVFATDGPWDMRKFMHECHVIRDGIAFPELFYRWIDVRRCFSDFFHKQLFKLTKMLRALGMNFVGERHRGIDDSRNIARVAIALAKRGYKYRQTASIPYRDEKSPILAHERSALALIKELEEEDAAKKRKKKNKTSSGHAKQKSK